MLMWYIYNITAVLGSFARISPSGLWPSGNIQQNFLGQLLYIVYMYIPHKQYIHNVYIYSYIYILLEPNIKDAGGNINLIYSRRE